MSKVEIVCSENGPNLIMVDGKVFSALCRCGQSSKKPYCDGTHAKVHFHGPKETIKILEPS